MVDTNKTITKKGITYPILDTPTTFDILLHNISLQIANAVVIVSEVGPDKFTDNCKTDLIEAYTNIRRHINHGPDENRFGASYAHGLMTKRTI